MDHPETKYAKTVDGVHIAYQVLGDGPVDMVYLEPWFSHAEARVGAQAGPSEILVSQTVKDLVAGSGLIFGDAGEHELKGVPDRWHLYRVMK